MRQHENEIPKEIETPRHSPTLTPGLRSFMMWQTLAAVKPTEDKIVVHEEHLILANKRYRIIDNRLRHWLIEDNIQYASIGGNMTGREILLIHPFQGLIADSFKHLLKQIMRDHDNQRQEITTISRPQIEFILQKVARFIREMIVPNQARVATIIISEKINNQNCLMIDEKKVPCIDLNVFLEQKVGVCRHYAVLTCLHLANLIKNKYLPAGEIFIDRNQSSTTPHAVACYIQETACWIIDPTLYGPHDFSAASAVSFKTINNNEDLPATLPWEDESPSSSSQSLLFCSQSS